jgi:hypothetical protein
MYVCCQDIINGIMASAPKHPYWEHVMDLLQKNAQGVLSGVITNKHVRPMGICCLPSNGLKGALHDM